MFLYVHIMNDSEGIQILYKMLSLLTRIYELIDHIIYLDLAQHLLMKDMT